MIPLALGLGVLAAVRAGKPTDHVISLSSLAAISMPEFVIASLLVAGLMLHAAYTLLKASGRVFMEAAPADLEPERIGRVLAAEPGVVEVHDLHVWEVTSGFPALSAHVLVRAGEDCHELRRHLQTMLEQRFEIGHTTLQVDHAPAKQRPLQIEVAPRKEG